MKIKYNMLLVGDLPKELRQNIEMGHGFHKV